MKTELVFRLFGSAAEVSRVLGISRAAASQWGERVPELRAYQLRERRPTIDAELAEMEQAAIRGTAPAPSERVA